MLPHGFLRLAGLDWCVELSSIDSVRTDFDRHHGGSFNVKDNAQVCFDLCRINDTSVTSRKPVDLVGTYLRSNGFCLKISKRLASFGLLSERQLSETPPECASGLESILHLSPGYGSLRAVSRSTTRPASASAIPSRNDSGIQESSFSTTNFATCARSLGGRALNCSISSAALI